MSELIARIRRFFAVLGPGVVTGAADDDPSGIATYSIAGAQFGTGFLWTPLATWPLMAAVQMMCARIGMVTGRGLTASLRRKLPRPVLIGVAVALFVANTINVGADLAGMADAAELLTGIDSHYLVVFFGVGIAWATIRIRYVTIARTLKWLALTLLAYAVAAFQVHPDWTAVARAVVTPTLPSGVEGSRTLVAILGTTISPYLFFWQASQEVEEEKALGRHRRAQRRGATAEEIRTRRLDVAIGTLFSNLVMLFIILTTALTLNRAGLTNIETSRDAAEALRPLAGRFAAALYTAGVVGVGLLAVPTLSGSAAYALAETFGWSQGLDRQFRRAPAFYTAVIIATLGGIAMDFANVKPVRALYWSAVLNGVLAPLLLAGILVVARDARLMAGQPSPRLGQLLVAITAVLMLAAAIGMVVV